MIKSGEIIEDLQYKGLKILRRSDKFSFGTDAVLLASFVRCYSKNRVADLGTGTGILPILVNGRTGAYVDAYEIQQELCDMAERSVIMNGQDKIRIIKQDIRTLKRPNIPYDAVMCNPPYYKSGERSENDSRAISIHQDTCSTDDVARATSIILKSGGNAFIVYPATSFLDIIEAFRKHSLELKRIRSVCSVRGKAPYLMLMEFKKDAKSGLIWENELVINEENGNMSEEAKRIYHICED